MKAGRKLDALIAEKVMGWKYRAYGNGGGEWTLNGKQMAFGGHNGGSLPNYSADIAAAWEVVEKADLWSLYGSIGDGPYRACIQFEDREGLMTADTAPLAICLAALKAVSQEGQG